MTILSIPFGMKKAALVGRLVVCYCLVERCPGFGGAVNGDTQKYLLRARLEWAQAGLNYFR